MAAEQPPKNSLQTLAPARDAVRQGFKTLCRLATVVLQQRMALHSSQQSPDARYGTAWRWRCLVGERVAHGGADDQLWVDILQKYRLDSVLAALCMEVLCLPSARVKPRTSGLRTKN